MASLYKCPRCGNYPGVGQKHSAYITANDGGSVSCSKCGCLHHMCVDGIKVGSPGPALCPKCAGISRQAPSAAAIFIPPHFPPTSEPSFTVRPAIKTVDQPVENVDMRLPYSVRAIHKGYK